MQDNTNLITLFGVIIENNRPVKFIVLEGNKFGDLNKNGNLDPYEDWRLAVDKRINDLISKMLKNFI